MIYGMVSFERDVSHTCMALILKWPRSANIASVPVLELSLDVNTSREIPAYEKIGFSSYL